MAYFVLINRILETAPAEKARFMEEFENNELEEKRIRAEVYLEKCQTPIEIHGKSWKIPVKQVEALVDQDKKVLEATLRTIKSKAQFNYAKDQLESFLEIARNLRAEVKWLEPTVKE